MIYINEWLPNPAGSDAAAEWVELYNAGTAPVSLDDWMLENENGKKAVLDGYFVPAQGYVVLRRTATKLALKNADGGLFLYDAKGVLADQAAFENNAPEGKSFSRIGYADYGPQQFIFEEPTPGMPNPMATITVDVREYPKGVPLGAPFTIGSVLGIMMGTALFTAGAFLYIILSNEIIAKFFFGTNKRDRPHAG